MKQKAVKPIIELYVPVYKLDFYSHQCIETSPFFTVDLSESTFSGDHKSSGTRNKPNNQTLATCLKNSGLAFEETELDLTINGSDPPRVHTTGIHATTSNHNELPGALKMYIAVHTAHTTHMLICYLFMSCTGIYPPYMYLCKLENIRPIAGCSK